MVCPSCSRDNRPNAKFCNECGAALPRACSKCGCPLPAGVKFCDECGTPIEGDAGSGARKIVTILFADLAGSTALHERLDPESARRFMESYYAAAREAVESHGGAVAKLLGDGVMAVFGIPRVAEDDAIRAVRAGVAMQAAFHALAEQQRGAVGETGLRVALNTGEVVVKGEELIGDPVNVAARLQERGRDGDVVIGESTRRLVATQVSLELLGSFDLKGRAEAVKAYRVISLDPPRRAAATPFVGREEELARIAAVYERALESPATHLAVLLGSPGLGKSRLIEEFARRSGEAATVVAAHCDAAGGATFAPLADALRELLALDAVAPADSVRAAAEAALAGEEAERGRIAAGIAGLVAGAPGAPEETFFVVRRFLAGLAATRPVVLILDDLQWAEPLLLDLVEHLVQWGRELRLLVLVGARPELRDLRSSLATPGALVADVVTLHGLEAGAAMRLAAAVIGAADLPAAVAAKVLATSEGNPLFIGELVRMLVDQGALTRDGERWTAGEALATVEMPPTIHALLAARIERLEPAQCAILERAAVVGRQFSRSAVAGLLPGNGAGLDAHLESLQRAELIERDAGWFLGEPVLRFHHVLIRDAAYRRLLKGTRAELHERLANWIEARVGDAAEHDETIGRHLERAHSLLAELGPLDAAAQRLGVRAAARLAAAGRRALEADDVPLAANLLGRALERLEADDPARADLALDWCEALLAAGDVGAAAPAIEELGRFATGTGHSPHEGGQGRLRAWHTCFAGQLAVLTAPDKLQATVETVAAAATSLASLDDAAGEAKGHFVHALALARLGRVGACEGSLDRALAAARRAGDRRRANTVLAIAPLAALWGPSPVTRASGRCLDVVRVLRITQGAPAVEAVALSCQGVLEALRGRTEAAHRMIASGRRMVEELGIAQRLFEADVFAGFVALLEDDVPAAEHTLRGAYDGLRELGLGIDAARAAALLARALLAQDRSEEAEALSHECQALAGDDLKAAIAWRGVRAEALARRGEHGAAIELAKAGVEIAATTDALLDHADARLALAAALRAAGRGAEADAEDRHAIELWEAKGATLLAERARRDGGRVARVGVAVAEPVPGTRAVRRRVRPNLATAIQARFDLALAARDLDAIAAVFHEDHREIDHPTGSCYGREAAVSSLQRLFRSREPHYEVEPLATLGDFLLLVRRRSGAAGAASARYDVGAYENEAIQLFEADGSGLCRSAEVFAADHLGDAVARLYERHAELLPEGAERDRAAATARSIAILASSNADPELLAPALAPDIEGIDHRHLSNWSLRGAPAYLDHLRALHQVADDVDFRWEEVLALAPDALLTRVLHRGTERVGGGAYERPFLSLFVAGADGRLTRAEWFDDGREAEALARFEEVAGASDTRAPARRSVRSNAATRISEGAARAIVARDAAGLERLLAEKLQFEHRPTGASYTGREFMATWRGAFKAEDLAFQLEVIASLGERTALHRHRVSVEGVRDSGMTDFGRAEFVEIVVVEADELGKCRRMDLFAAEKLGDAVVRLYESFAESLADGPERTRVRTIARAVAAHIGPIDPDRMAAAMDPVSRNADHRVLGTWTTGSADEVLQHYRHQLELAPDFAARFDDVLALAPDALLARVSFFGTARERGGPFENRVLLLFTFGADGRLGDSETFEAEQETRALTRFHQLTGPIGPLRPIGPIAPTEPFANPASRADRDFVHRFNTRAWAAIEALAAPELVFDERRRMLHNTCGRDVWLEQLRVLFDVPASRFTTKLLATRGERLALSLHCFAGEVAGGGGPLAMEDHFALHQVDGAGRIVAIVLFDVEAEDAAHAELDRRFESGEGAADPALRRLRDVAATQQYPDPEAMAALFAPTFVARDHRLVGWGVRVGGPAFLESLQALNAMAPDVRLRADHVRTASDGIVIAGAWIGTHEGGAFEIPLIAVVELDADRRAVRLDLYDPEHVDRALARFEEIAGNPGEGEAPLSAGFRGTGPAELGAPVAATDRFANAALRALDRMLGLWMERDWENFAQSFPAGFHMSDRRRAVQLELDRDGAIAFSRTLGELAVTRSVYELLATRGDRLALVRARIEAAGGDVGPSEMRYLGLWEVNVAGESTVGIRWDEDDLDEATAELDRRWEAGEARSSPAVSAWVARFREGFAARDWEALAALTAPDQVAVNHRLVGWGTLAGHAAWVSTLQALVELSPDVRFRLDHLRVSGHAFFWSCAWEGERDGGSFETPILVVGSVDDSGLEHTLEVWDPDQVSAAQSRFAALAGAKGGAAAFGLDASESSPTRAGSDRLTPPPESPFANAASRSLARGWRVWAARDWEGILAVLSPAVRMDDRRRMVRLEIGPEDFLVQFRMLFDQPGSRWEGCLLATRGQRLCLHRTVFHAQVDVGGGPLQLDEHLSLQELDADGRLAAFVTFDVEAEDAAYAELDARFEAGEGAAPSNNWRSLTGFVRAVERRDWDAVRALCREDFVERDHRGLAVLGRTEGAGAWVDNFRTLVELAPDTVYRAHHVQEAARGYFVHGSWYGTREGGPYELQVNAVLELDEAGRIRRADIYDDAVADAALARLAELEEPAATPRFANAATRAMDRGAAAHAGHDWEAFAAVFAADCTTSDRRAHMQAEFDREQWLASLRPLFDMPSSRLVPEALATRGDRLALLRCLWRGAGGDVGQSEIDWLMVAEADEHGALRRLVELDADDLDAAYAELDARWQAGEAAEHPTTTRWLADYLRFFAARDWSAMAALFAPDILGENHRLVGWGTRRGPEGILSTLRAQIELAPDTRERVDHVRTDPRALLFEYAWHGTHEGGEFENVWVVLVELDAAGRARRADVWEAEQLEQALARFEEARSSSVAPPPRFANDATRAVDRGTVALAARDWEAFAALMAPGFRHYDRTRFAQLESDGREWLASFRRMVEMTSAPPAYRVLATRGERLALFEMLWRGAGGDVGPSEIDWRLIVEVNERGEHVAIVVYEPDDLDAAYAELDARFEAERGDRLPASWRLLRRWGRAVAERDWETVGSLCAGDLVEQDHRSLSVLGVTRGVEPWIQVLRTVSDIAPDSVFRIHHFVPGARGYYEHGGFYGTREGGPFEIVINALVEIDDQGLIARIDLYDDERVFASSRWAELGLSGAAAARAAADLDTRGATVARQNLAHAVMRRWLATYDHAAATGDWDAMREVCAPHLLFDDRRRLALLSGGLDLMVASARERLATGARVSFELLGTAGERIAIERVLWSGGPADGPFEIEYLGLCEVDETGRITAMILYDADEGPAVRREAWRRWAAIEPEIGETLAVVSGLTEAFNAHDRGKVRALCDDDLVYHDHRRTGVGRIDDAGAAIASIEEYWKLAGDQELDLGWHWPAYGRHGGVTVVRRFGTLPDGGAFESEYLEIFAVRHGRAAHLELFELADLERALARFEELRPPSSDTRRGR